MNNTGCQIPDTGYQMPDTRNWITYVLYPIPYTLYLYRMPPPVPNGTFGRVILNTQYPIPCLQAEDIKNNSLLILWTNHDYLILH